MATVYRFENKEHVGVYSCLGCFVDITDNTSIYDCHRPTPLADAGINRRQGDNERCGFESLEQLFDWFEPINVEELAIQGVQLVEIRRVHITAHGDKQVLFMPPRDYLGNIKEKRYHVISQSNPRILACLPV